MDFSRLRNVALAIEGFWSLWKLVTENWRGLMSAAALAYGPLLFLWRYVQLTAANVGWWVYPFVFSLAFFAMVGLYLLYLAARGRIQLMGTSERLGRDRVAEEIDRVVVGLTELMADYWSEKNSAWDADSERFSHAARAGDPMPPNTASTRLNEKLMRKFGTAYYGEVRRLTSEAATLVPISQNDLWEMRHISGDHSINTLIEHLTRISVHLRYGKEPLPSVWVSHEATNEPEKGTKTE